MKTGKKKWFLAFFSQMLNKITPFDTCKKFLNIKANGELHHCISQKAVSQQCMNLIVIIYTKKIAFKGSEIYRIQIISDNLSY